MDFIRIGRGSLLLLCGAGLVGIVSASSVLAQSAGAGAASAPGRAGSLGGTETTSTYQFSYRYPEQVAALPGLVAWLDQDRRAAQAKLAASAREWHSRAARDDLPLVRFEQESEWAVVAQLADWVSLSQRTTSYEGGAHPSHTVGSIVWDGRAQRSRRPITLFVSEAALDQAVQPALCSALDRERSSRRGGGPVVRDPSDPSTGCVPAKAATILLGSAGRKAFDRIGFVFDPYVAGPYVEGAYEVTLPVTPAVVAAVRPEFRAAFVPGR